MAFDLGLRRSGVLLHLSSLPGPPGQGDLGPEALAFADWLGRAGQAWWQMLPIGPCGPGDSPYQSPSAFAGDPLLLSLQLLAEDGWLSLKSLPPSGEGHPASRGRAEALRQPLLQAACAAFRAGARPAQREEFEAFCLGQAHWLEDWALYAALKRRRQGRAWFDWESELRHREPAALASARKALAEELEAERFWQWQFQRQWGSLRRHASGRGVGLIGDLPIFVSHDSADAWGRRDLFELDPEGRPLAVAGVPPDYFSAEGQLWGNPLYRWEAHRADGYAWWKARFARLLDLFDAVRVDHFIGFHRYWSVPAGAASAREGSYRPGPGAELFEALRTRFGSLPIIAEDLGVVTPEVDALRRRFGLPGMRVLQFSFGGEAALRPEAWPEDTAAYTGTHDNDTCRGWLEEPGPAEAGSAAARAQAAERERARAFAAAHDPEPLWGLLAGVWASPARLALAPAQDLLGQGPERRMNLPGTPSGNWRYRLNPGALSPALAARLRDLSARHRRL